MGEKISDITACKKLVKTVLENYRLPYITITPTFSICPKHGYISGEHDYCPRCDHEIGYVGPEYDMSTRLPYTADKIKIQSLAEKEISSTF